MLQGTAPSLEMSDIDEDDEGFQNYLNTINLYLVGKQTFSNLKKNN